MTVKNNSNNFYAMIAVVAIVVAAYFAIKSSNQENRIKELEKNDPLEPVQESIKDGEFTEEIKDELSHLVKEFKDLDISISEELSKTIQLIQIGQFENAVRGLVKIVEELLNKLYNRNQSYLNWIKQFKKNQDNLHNKILFCAEEKKITETEKGFFLAIKIVRNEESHKTGFKLQNWLTAVSLIVGLGAIIKIGKLVFGKI